MEFCPECDSLLIIEKQGRKNLLKCRDCNYTVKLNKKHAESFILSDEIQHKENEITEIVEDDNASQTIPTEIREDLMESYRESIESFNY